MTTVRPVRPDEHDAVGQLTQDAYDAIGRVSDEYRTALADITARLDGDTVVLVAVDDGDAVGTVTVVGRGSTHFEHRRHGDGGFRMLAVAPSAQGRGVGSALLDAALAHARTHGWRRLAITTMDWMPRAQAMYEAAGFVRRPDLDVRYTSGVGLGYVLDLIDDAADHFPPPDPVPDEPPVFRPRDEQPPGC